MRRLVITVSAALAMLASGLSGPDGSAAYEPPESQTSKPASAPAPKPAPALKPDELDRLFAPVALYPDALLAQMLLCAGNPGKVGALNEWLASNKTLKGTELQAAAEKSGFGPSFVALVLFPQVVAKMVEQFDWTTRVGQAFTADRTAVFASIQRLRTKAKNAGNLKTTPQQEVETRTTSSGEQVIVIEPANPQVVYVPQYNPQVVYTQSSTTVVVKESNDNSAAVAAGLIGFTAGIALGAAIDNDYYYGPHGFYGGGGYMYNDAWDDYYDAREDARDDWQDHREDLADERGDRAGNTQEQRTDRQQNRQENRPESTQAQRDQARTKAESASTQKTSASTASQESRGYSRSGEAATKQRSGTGSDAFSGYSSGKSTRASSSRGQQSRSSSRGGGGKRR